MAQYIDKDALVAEINRLKRKARELYGCSQFDTAYENVLKSIDTLEVKEVDLGDKGEWKNTGGFGSTWDPDSPDYYPD